MKKPAIMCVVFCLVLSMCARMTKEDSIQNFKRFVETAEERAPAYSEADWLKSDKGFNRRLRVLEKRYRGRLSTEEKIIVAAYRLRYNAARYRDSVKSGISNYIDGDFKDDVDFLIKQGVKVTDIISKSLSENLPGYERD